MIQGVKLMNRIIFGDNQFFGVNHLSEEKSRIQSKKFQNVQNIIKVLDFVNEIGIKDFMVTTYADLQEICNHFSLNPDKYKGFRINPCLPYAHKYANEVSELGILGTLNKYLKGNVFKNIKKGGVALLKKDFINIMEILIDVEVKMFNNVEKECIFLQNVVTDLLLGLGMDNFFVEFDKYIKNTYNVKAGFITMNMPLLYDRLEAKGIKNPIICTSFNKINFRMSGGVALYEQYAKEKDMHLIAMQVLAAGALSPREAFEYISKIEGINSILFGSATPSHILESKDMIEKFSKIN